MKHKCGYEDCFNCPFYDCIVNGTDPADPNPSDFLLTKPMLTEEQRRERHREYNKMRYRLKKEEYRKKSHEQYLKRKARKVGK